MGSSRRSQVGALLAMGALPAPSQPKRFHESLQGGEGAPYPTQSPFLEPFPPFFHGNEVTEDTGMLPLQPHCRRWNGNNGRSRSSNASGAPGELGREGTRAGMKDLIPAGKNFRLLPHLSRICWLPQRRDPSEHLAPLWSSPWDAGCVEQGPPKVPSKAGNELGSAVGS